MEHSDFTDLDELYNDFNKITPSMLKRYNFPIEIKQLIVQDYLFFKNLVNLYHYEIAHNNIISKLEITDNKKYIHFNDIIYKKLIEENDIYYNSIIKLEEKKDIEPILDVQAEELEQVELDIPVNYDSKFFRKNQQDAINKMKEQGFISGINCQIMGAGKSYII